MSDPLGILACYAHPDDEQGVSGTLAKAVRDGRRAGILMTTRGEVGEIADPILATPETLGAVREGEMRCAAEALGIPAENIFFFDYRDSGMAGTGDNAHTEASMNADEDEAVGRIVQLLRAFRPAVVLTFDENGGYGHPDHIAVHRWTTAAFHAASQADRYPAAGPPYQPARLFYASFPRSWIRRFADLMREAGITPEQTAFAAMDPEKLGMPDELITHRVDTSDFVEAKERSLACHATQLNPNNPLARLPEDLRRTMRSTEVFHFVTGVPFPPGDPGDDLFAGLE